MYCTAHSNALGLAAWLGPEQRHYGSLIYKNTIGGHNDAYALLFKNKK
jgi:hypothetical protein